MGQGDSPDDLDESGPHTRAHQSSAPRRGHPPRLKGWDYSWAAAYFVTLVVKDRWCCLGTIEDEVVQLSPSGSIVEECWQELPGQFPGVELDALVIMPNHVHAILCLTGQDDSLGGGAWINQGPRGQGQGGQVLPGASPGLQSMMADPKLVLGKVIRAWKGKSSRLIRLGGDETFTWQSRYYDHIIRNEAELGRVRQYIASNPARRTLDTENPAR